MKMRPLPLLSAAVALGLLLQLTAAGQAALPQLVLSDSTTRVSVASDGTQGNGTSLFTTMSADGRFIAFYSESTNLVAGDTNGSTDIFIHDRQSGATERVSVPSGGGQGNNHSSSPSISDDGRYVAFTSLSSNLVAGDSNNVTDVFVHDRQTGGTSRVSVSSSGTQGNQGSFLPSISGDGRFISFRSAASNLVPGDTNGRWDIFVHDRQTGDTSRVSVSSSGEQANNHSDRNAISADGRFVAFDSDASNLVPGDTNGIFDVFLHDRQNGQTERVSLATGGGEGNNSSLWPSISADGRFVAFFSAASNLVPGDVNGELDIFVHERLTGQTERVSVSSAGAEGNGQSIFSALSADGRYVAFESAASNLVPSDTNGQFDVFVHDRQNGLTERVSLAAGGGEGNSSSLWPSLSADGRFVAFYSFANNFVPGDTNGVSDIFVRDRLESGVPLEPRLYLPFTTR